MNPRLVCFVEGKKGGVVGYTKEGKVILPTKGFTPSVGEVWLVQLTDHSRYYLAEPIKRLGVDVSEGYNEYRDLDSLIKGELNCFSILIEGKWRRVEVDPQEIAERETWYINDDNVSLLLERAPKLSENPFEGYLTATNPYIPKHAVLDSVIFSHLEDLERDDAPLRALKVSPPKEIQDRILEVFDRWRQPRLRLLRIGRRLAEILSSIPSPPSLPPVDKSGREEVRRLEERLEKLWRKLNETPPLCTQCGKAAVKVPRRPSHQEILERDEGATREYGYYWECPDHPWASLDYDTPDRKDLIRKIREIEDLLPQIKEKANEKETISRRERKEVVSSWWSGLTDEQKLALLIATNHCPVHQVVGQVCPNGELWNPITETHHVPSVDEINAEYMAENFERIRQEVLNRVNSSSSRSER